MSEITSWLLSLNVAELKKKTWKKNRWIQKEKIPESEISACPEHKVKSKIGNILLNEKILEEYRVRIYEIDPYLYKYCEELIKVDENGGDYILFGIDNYLPEHRFAVEINEKGHTDGYIILEEKRQEALE